MDAISLFSGIGGIDVGAAEAGFNIVLQVEIDKFCRERLADNGRYWPNAVRLMDVRSVGRGRRYRLPPAEFIFGGFPCQPFSSAGSRRAHADSRNMWPEFRRIIRDARPRAVLLENVQGILSAYVDSAGVRRPAYALTVIGNLAALGYVSRWGIVSASDAGAPHQRDRWWCVAYRDSVGYDATESAEISADSGERVNNTWLPRRRKGHNGATLGDGQVLGDSGRWGLPIGTGESDRLAESGMGWDANGLSDWLVNPKFPAGPFREQYDYEPPRQIEKVQRDSHWSDRIKSYGNAVVPQIAYGFCKHIYQRLEGKG